MKFLPHVAEEIQIQIISTKMWPLVKYSSLVIM